MKAWCLFEQSGTFKNEFKKLGIDAVDADICNDFGETNYQIDLFDEINKKFEGGVDTIFDEIDKDDIVLAFFPCVRFEDQIEMYFNGNNHSERDWNDKKKILYAMNLENERAEMYTLFAKLVIIAMDNGLQLIIENPYSSKHYMKQYFPVKPSIIDKNRRENGDYYKKPTQYWFINCEPKRKMLFESIEWVEPMKVEFAKKFLGQDAKVARSLIHPQYASRFIRQEIL